MISQAEARSLRKRVEELEAAERNRRNAWNRDYPGGVNIASLSYSDNKQFLPAVLHVSRKLGHAVVCTVDGSTVLFYAIPHPEMPT